ncbi:interferon lambda receptor 1 isoform X1 [Zootoca vivipara]|uniref:interferon lambda receptor 1 isoform X1 n=1 Tax=Zootoca vivipara TaxID=8524 RepID=UPI00293BC30E|nr:interferon lambda receptor 1 isoform X1 [Zootoca vivipara]
MGVSSQHNSKASILQLSPSAVIMEPKKVKSLTASISSPSICQEVMGPVAMILVFLMLSFRPYFALSSFTLIKRFFNSSSLSAIKVVSPAYLRLLIFLPAILIPVWGKIGKNQAFGGRGYLLLSVSLNIALTPVPSFPVELAPPILQLKKTENALDVSIAFSYPSCAKATFQDLTYDLEYGIDGAGKPRNFTETKKNVLGFDTTHWSSGRYCFRARAFVSEKWSNYSKPVCTLLHEKAENWAFVAVPLLLMLPAGAFVVFCWYRNMNNQIKMPQALDFSKGPTKLLLIGERESIKLDSFTCTGALVESGRRNRTGPQIHSTLSPSVLSEENEEDEDDDSGSPIAYMEVLRFQKKSVNCQMASMCLEAPLPSSGYGSSQSGLPDLMVPGVPVSTEWVTGESSSGFQENEGTSSSESSSVEESLEFPVGFPTARGKEWDEDIDFSSVLIEGRGINLPTGKQFMPVRSHSEENCTSLEDLKIPLFGMLGNQDSCGLHFEEQFVDKRGSEKDCSGCGSLVDEIPLLGVPCRGALEPGLLGENRDLESGRIPEPKFHGYRPRHTHYIART